MLSDDELREFEIIADVHAARVKTLKREKRRLEDMLFKMGAMEKRPCFICGYDGAGYYQPGTHKCAKRHHRLLKI